MSFDLNIANYKMSELEDMFELSPNYGQTMVHSKEVQVREKIRSDKTISESVKINTINFLVKAKEVLLNNCIKSNDGK